MPCNLIRTFSNLRNRLESSLCISVPGVSWSGYVLSLSSISGVLAVFFLIKSISYVISISVLSLNQSRL